MNTKKLAEIDQNLGNAINNFTPPNKRLEEFKEWFSNEISNLRAEVQDSPDDSFQSYTNLIEQLGEANDIGSLTEIMDEFGYNFHEEITKYFS